MATVVRRRFVSSPQRDTHQTWCAITELLTRSNHAGVRAEFDAVSGVAASIIAERTPADVPIVVTCDGPRTLIYCLYDNDAIDGSEANENALAFDPLSGDWQVSLPCSTDDLDWVQAELKKCSDRIAARGPDESVTKESNEHTTPTALTLIPEKFLAS